MADTTAVQKMYPFEYLVGSLIAGLIIGVLVSSLWSSSTIKNPIPTATTTPALGSSTAMVKPSVKVSLAMPTSKPSSASASKLIINDQSHGLTVAITEVHVTENEWVVIHEDRGGVLGNALGAARFLGGATSGVVDLLRQTVQGRTYYGLIYKDDGDHVFSKQRDTPVKDASGNTLRVTFRAN